MHRWLPIDQVGPARDRTAKVDHTESGDGAMGQYDTSTVNFGAVVELYLPLIDGRWFD